LAQHEVCDAHPELVRAAREVGQPTSEDCPICQDHTLVLVSYVFGPRLPAFGRCITTAKELKASRSAQKRAISPVMSSKSAPRAIGTIWPVPSY
jgi:hypothetical protein